MDFSPLQKNLAFVHSTIVQGKFTMKIGPNMKTLGPFMLPLGKVTFLQCIGGFLEVSTST
ncbi:hypothetical protein RchiOBHm_Chr1g0376481 [Rosa chinensis]|uniref:Uncharacterized protein n=1 Tax=Rosa chinensis TaxID=74649 RepID=A0A2P6SMW9_ROSCH|nr:hypothetical protein RchiOBHm_Chr1g0376481 [Rosa chinensis]